MRHHLSTTMTGGLLTLLLLGAAPVEGTLAVLPAHSPSGALLQGQQALVDAVVHTALDRGLSVVDVDVVKSTLVTLAAQGIRCADAACFARVGQFAGADVVIVPVIDGAHQQLLRVDVADGRADLDVPIAAGGTAAAVAWVLDGGPPPAALTITGPGNAALFVDEAPRGTLPLDAPLKLAPGAHRVQLRAGDRTSEIAVVTLAAAEKRTLVVSLKPSRSAPDADAPAAGTNGGAMGDDDDTDLSASKAPGDDGGGVTLLWAGVGLAGAGAALAAVGAAVGVVGYVANDAGPALPADTRVAAGLVGDAGFVAAALVLVVGVVAGGALITVWGVSHE